MADAPYPFRALALQARMEQASASVLSCCPADRLWRDLRKYLIHASDQRLIRQSERDVHQLLPRPVEADFERLGLERVPQVRLWSVAVGAVRNFHRNPELPHLTRADGAWFDFQLLVREQGRESTVLAYDWEIRFAEADAGRPAWIRFDLNPPGHDNASDGRRAHVHLGSDDDGLVLPCSVLSPFEAMDLLVHGLRRTGRVRGVASTPTRRTAFEA